MKKSVEENIKFHKYDYTEITFNIEDVCFTICSYHDRDNSPLFNEKVGVQPPKYSKESKASPHHHPYYEVFFTHYGENEIDLDDETIYLGKDDLVLIPPQTMHTAKDKNEEHTICFDFLFRQNNCKTENRLYKLLCDVFSAPYIHIKRCPKLYDLMQNFTTSVDLGNTFMLSRYFYEIIIEILNETGNLTRLSPDEMLKDSTISRYRKINYLLRFYNNESISLEYIADNLNLSQRQTARIIKEEFGCTLSEIIQQKRMKQAERYLLNPKMAIAEISAMVGYDSINCFYTAFKKHYGCLPGEYRKKLNSK